MAWKQTKRVFKNKQPSDPFLKTVKIFSSHVDGYVEFKMRLDTGCEVHNLITLQAVYRLHMFDNMTIHNESICTCLNGEQLISMAYSSSAGKANAFARSSPLSSMSSMVIPFYGMSFSVPKLKFAGFGGASPILPKKTKEEKAHATARKRERNEKAAANDAKVNADIRAKEEAARQTRSNADGSSSGSSGVNRG